GDPEADHFHFGGAQAVVLPGRHGAAMDLLEEQARLRLAGDDHRTGFATLAKPRRSAEVELRFPRLAAVAAHTLLLKERQDAGLELLARREGFVFAGRRGARKPRGPQKAKDDRQPEPGAADRGAGGSVRAADGSSLLPERFPRCHYDSGRTRGPLPIPRKRLSAAAAC